MFTACRREKDYIVPAGKGALHVSLQNSAEDVEDLAFYVFRPDGRQLLCLAYNTPHELSSEYIPLDPGNYLITVIANTGTSLPAEAKTAAKSLALPQETTMPDLTVWLEDHAADFPNLLTASAPVTVNQDEVHRLTLTLKDGTNGIGLSAITLKLTVPDKTMPCYAAARTGDEDVKPLCCVAEVYQAGTSNRVHRRVQDCTLQADGTYLAELSLMPGDYDLRLWADWDGGYYNADDLGKVLVLTDNYVVNGETDKKDAYYATTTLSVPSSPTGGVEGAVSLVRPFAKYRLIATDVEAYYNLISKGENLPAIEDLQVRVTYEGFFPTGFNVATGKPNDALNTGIHYSSVPTVAEGYDTKVNRQVGADFVLTNGEESFVNVTIQMVDTNTGEAVATVQHVKIPYKRGHLTTVTGHFLTAGKTPGGVQIDTEWGEDIVIEF